MADDAPGRPRHLYLVGLLTFASGCVDAVTLTVIGGAFTSVITGNLILIGRGLGTATLDPALHAAMAVAGYIVGVALGSRLAQRAARAEAGQPSRAWPRRATTVLAAESVLLIAINAAWIGYGARPPTAAADVLLIVAGICLGMQGAAARTIAGNPSTTYMTGALTGLVEALVTGQARKADPTAAVGLPLLVAGAACGAVLIHHARSAALLPALAAIMLVVLIKRRHHHTESSMAETPSSPPS